MVPGGIDQLQGVHGRGQALVAAATAVGAATLDMRALAARVRGQPRPPWARIAYGIGICVRLPDSRSHAIKLASTPGVHVPRLILDQAP